MALDARMAAVALHRFGLGPRAGTIALITSDPQGALLAELDQPKIGQITDPALITSAAANRAVFEDNAERGARERQERKRREAAKVAMESATAEKSMEAGAGMEPKPASEPPPVPLGQQIFFKEAKARFDAAVNAEIGFVERLVW